MIEKIKSPRFVVLSLLVLLAACTRALPLLIPHSWNFTGIGALAIFAGAQFKDSRFAFAMPLAAMLLADLFIIGEGLDLLVYIGFVFMVACGVCIRGRADLFRVGLASVVGTLVFYLITNFAYFYTQDIHPHNWAGVVESYVVALPFLRNMLIGDLFYGVLLFGGFHFIEKHYPILSIS